MRKSALSTYKDNKLQGIQEASPIKLVSMLLDEAISCIETAAIACENSNLTLKAKSISRSMAIIDQGLYSVLDFDKGGAVAASLGQTYQAILTKLFEANIKNDAALCIVCCDMMKQVREGWTAVEALDKG